MTRPMTPRLSNGKAPMASYLGFETNSETIGLITPKPWYQIVPKTAWAAATTKRATPRWRRL